MNIIETGIQAGLCDEEGRDDNSIIIEDHLERFAQLVAAQERDAIMKLIEELRPVEDNPLLQTKPAAFWIENFRQIIYARSKA
jgi:hypothetical protein